VGGWIADVSFLARVLAALGPGVHVDAIGPACYFGPRQATINAWLAGSGPQGVCPNCPTPDEVIAAARAFIPELGVKLAQHRLLANATINPDGSIPALELYEAGQSFVANFQPWADAAQAAQTLPAMFDAYVFDFVPMMVSQGVDRVIWYSFVSDNAAQGNGAGPFGHWDSMDETITLPVPDPYVHEGVPKAAAIYKGPPRRYP
jgi:hypothetical protein